MSEAKQNLDKAAREFEQWVRDGLHTPPEYWISHFDSRHRKGEPCNQCQSQPVEHKQPAREGEEWQRKDNEVFVHREMTPDELSEARARGFKTTDIRYTIARFYGDNAEDNAQTAVRNHRLAALVPRLVDNLRFLRDTAFALHVNDRHRPEAFSICEHHVCQRACKTWNETMATLNAITKESRQ